MPMPPMSRLTPLPPQPPVRVLEQPLRRGVVRRRWTRARAAHLAGRTSAVAAVVLALAAVPLARPWTMRARVWVTERRGDRIARALEAYRRVVGRYPTSLSQL